MSPEPRHLQRFAGLVETNKGQGIVVEAVRQPNGALANTVQQYLEEGRYDIKTQEEQRTNLDHRWCVRADGTGHARGPMAPLAAHGTCRLS